ncbi:MAG: hypothetical protein IKU62_06805 [Ruminiclostridium sp.]|nr:hypothetical protein [Ruminiclostridium sp.]
MSYYYNTETALLGLVIAGFAVWTFNSYRLGKFRGKKVLLPWVLGSLLVLVILAYLLYTT